MSSGPGQVVVLGRAQEAEAVGQDLEHALGEDQALLLGLGPQDLEDQLLLLHRGGARDLERLRHRRPASWMPISLSTARSSRLRPSSSPPLRRRGLALGGGWQGSSSATSRCGRRGLRGALLALRAAAAAVAAARAAPPLRRPCRARASRRSSCGRSRSRDRRPPGAGGWGGRRIVVGHGGVPGGTRNGEMQAARLLCWADAATIVEVARGCQLLCPRHPVTDRRGRPG